MANEESNIIVVYVTCIASITTAAAHMGSVLAVMTDNSHSNASFICHVAIHLKWSILFITVRIDDVPTTDVTDLCFHSATCFRVAYREGCL